MDLRWKVLEFLKWLIVNILKFLETLKYDDLKWASCKIKSYYFSTWDLTSLSPENGKDFSGWNPNSHPFIAVIKEKSIRMKNDTIRSLLNNCLHQMIKQTARWCWIMLYGWTLIYFKIFRQRMKLIYKHNSCGWWQRRFQFSIFRSSWQEKKLIKNCLA